MLRMVREYSERSSLPVPCFLSFDFWNKREKWDSGFKIKPEESQFPHLHREGIGLDGPFQL